MEITGVWLLGWYLIGPFRVMMALLSCISTETSGGPKLAIWIDKNNLSWNDYSQNVDSELPKSNVKAKDGLSSNPTVFVSSRQNVTYCLTVDRISYVSRPIWKMLSCPQCELWRGIPAPDPVSHCSDHTSFELFLYSVVPPSSVHVFLYCPPGCPHSWKRQMRPTQWRGGIHALA